ncbi:hypothetical protein KCP78_05955 [Salmonella enterica subsp. enterica]|nr:hypothetical protein KCP78_05955 [Salmonella enterica subsp. enterica]
MEKGRRPDAGAGRRRTPAVAVRRVRLSPPTLSLSMVKQSDPEYIFNDE